MTMAISQAVLGVTSNVVAAALLQVFGSAAFALFNVTAVTMRHRQVPDALLGRVSSIYGTVTQGAEALGALAGGALAATIGLRAPMLIGAVPIGIATVLLAARHRHGNAAAPPAAS